MSGVHDVTKRRPDVGDRYRLTRIAFDVISVFGSLRARGVPGPVIVRLLAEHGYSAASVHNQLTRMIQRGQLTRERRGRETQYRLGEHLVGQFDDIAGEHSAPEFRGHFHAAVYAIPEAARHLRDRFQYSARMLGYRQLRAGLFLGFADRSERLHAQLPEMTDGGWYEFLTLTPPDFASAQRMTATAFELTCARAEIDALETALARLRGSAGTPGGGAEHLPIGRFFDLYYQVGRAVLENPLLPIVLAGEDQPAMRFRALMDECNVEYLARYDADVRAAAAEHPSYARIEWLTGPAGARA